MGALLRKFLVTIMITALAACGSGGGSGGGGASSANTKLNDVTMSESVTLDQPFDPNVSNYTGSVANNVSSFSITPSVEDPNSLVTINGMSVEPGRASPAVPLNVGENIITMVVTAPDGSTQRTYTFAVARAADLNANLAGLSLSAGILDQSFNANVYDYSATVANTVTSISVIPTAESSAATIIVNGIPVNSGQSSSALSLLVGSNAISVVVTAEDMLTQKTYRLVVTRSDIVGGGGGSGGTGGGTTLSSDANLSALSLGGVSLSPAFAANTTSYAASVANNVSSLSLTATASYSGASITVNGGTVVSGQSSNVSLHVGVTNIAVVVTAQDGTVKSYSVAVTRVALTNADLSAISLSTGTLSPAFGSNTYSYSVSVANAVTSIGITPAVADSSASIKVNTVTHASGSAYTLALAEGSNLASIVVTAQDGITVKTYNVTVTRATASGANVDLSALSLSSGAVSPTFNAGTTSYSQSVVYATATLTVTPTVADATSTVTVNNVSVASGVASGNIVLNVGSNTITVKVTSQDGLSNKIYSVVVTRASNTNADLSALGLSTGIFNETFSAATTSYTQSVANNITSVTVTPTVAGAATIKVNGTTVASGVASGVITLNVGSNVITVVVTAEDGVTTKSYTITITRIGNNNADLANLGLSTGAMNQGFVASTTSYTQSVANNITGLTVTPTLADTNASVTVNGVVVASGFASGNILLNVGVNDINVLVTAEDGTTQKNYLVSVTRAASTDATLSGLSLSVGTLSPSFASGTLSYTASVSNATSQLTITATANDSNYQSLTVNTNPVTSGLASGLINLNVGDNPIDVVVTAQDGSTVNTYTVTVTRAASTNADLSALSLSTGTLSPVFAAGTTSYNVTVDNASSSVQFVATAADSNYSSLKVNNVSATSGLASSAVSLNVGDNVIPVQVIAQDALTTKTYNVTIHRKSGDADLASLSLSTGTLNPVFAAGTTSYTATVSNATSSITITAGVSDTVGYTGLTINSVAASTGVASGAISLIEGDNVIPVVVTAEDNTITKTYNVTVTRLPVAGSDATLSSLTLSTGALDQTFQSNSTSYTMSVNYLVSGIQFTPSMTDPLATMTVNGQAVANATASQTVVLTEGLNSVSIIVTAQDLNTTKTYTIDVTRQTAATFAQRAYIKASNTNAVADGAITNDLPDQFGNSVAISGDTLVVGAPNEDSGAVGINDTAHQVDDCSAATPTNCNLDSGAVYVFVRDGAGVWSQQAYIKQPAGDYTGTDDYFGYSVAIDGDTLVVGAPAEDSVGNDAGNGVVNAASFPANWSSNGAGADGAVYVYKRTGTTWAHEAFFKQPTNTTTGGGDQFGSLVAISGDTIAVAAIYEDGSVVDVPDNSANNAGAVFTFTRSGVTWSFEKYHKATNIQSGDQFGMSLSLDGDFMVVGAAVEDGSGTGINPADDNTAAQAGAAYVYKRTVGVWDSGTYIKASNAQGGDYFGHDVAIKGTTMAIGAPRESSGVSGNPADNSKYAAGAVYIFTYDGANWSQQAYVKATVKDASDFFGMQVALGDGMLVVSAPGEDSTATTIDGNSADNTAANSGAVYVFTGSGASWTQQKYVKVHNTSANDELGGSTSANFYNQSKLAVSGDTVVVSTELEDGSGQGIDPTSDDASTSAGAAYVFQ